MLSRGNVIEILIFNLAATVSMSTWNRKLNKLLRETMYSAQTRLSEAEADMEVRRWEKRRSDLALYETNRELESQRLELNQSNRWADQAQKERVSLHGEWETMENWK